MVTTITPAQLRWALDSGDTLALFDIRERKAVDRGHILESTNLPRRKLPTRLGELVPTGTTTVVLYEDDDAMANNVAEGVAAYGYTDVRVLEGGLRGWEADGQAVTTGRNVPSKGFGELIQHHDRVPMVSPRQLSTWLEQRNDIVIFDVRTAAEHARETIPGSIHVPGFELPAVIDRYADEDATVVVHCSGRTRSIVGTQTVRLTGHANVYALENGTMGWMLAGLTPDHGATRTPDDLPVTAPDSVRGRWIAHARSVGVRFVDPARAAALVEQGTPSGRPLQLIDARLRDRFEAGHAPGARNVPSGQLVQRADDHLAVRNAVTLIVCDDGVRSCVAAYWLRRMGRGDVLVVAGGMAAWDAAGLPVTTDASDALLPPRDAPEPIDGAQLVRDTDGSILLSVLGSREHAAGHPERAHWISATWLERDLRIHAPPDRRVVLIAQDDTTAAWLATDARRAGWSEATWLRGGLAAWVTAGGSTDRGLPDGLEPDDHFPHPITRGRRAMQSYLDWEHQLGNIHI